MEKTKLEILVFLRSNLLSGEYKYNWDFNWSCNVGLLLRACGISRSFLMRSSEEEGFMPWNEILDHPQSSQLIATIRNTPFSIPELIDLEYLSSSEIRAVSGFSPLFPDEKYKEEEAGRFDLYLRYVEGWIALESQKVKVSFQIARPKIIETTQFSRMTEVDEMNILSYLAQKHKYRLVKIQAPDFQSDTLEF